MLAQIIITKVSIASLILIKIFYYDLFIRFFPNIVTPLFILLTVVDILLTLIHQIRSLYLEIDKFCYPLL